MVADLRRTFHCSGVADGCTGPPPGPEVVSRSRNPLNQATSSLVEPPLDGNPNTGAERQIGATSVAVVFSGVELRPADEVRTAEPWSGLPRRGGRRVLTRSFPYASVPRR